MIRALDRYFSVEMFSLWLIEFVLVAVVISFLFTMGPGSVYGSWESVPRVAEPGILLAITISTVSVAIGLYRPEICLQLRQLAVNALVVAVLAFIAISMMRMGRLIDISFEDGSAGLNRAVVQAFAGWVACLIFTRLVFNAALRMNLFARRVLVVGSNWSASRVQDIISARQSGFCQLVGSITPDAFSTSEYLQHRKVWAVVVADEVAGSFDLKQQEFCRRRGAMVLGENAFRELRLQSLDIESLPTGWMQASKAGSRDSVYRAFDLVVSIAFLFFTLPVVIVTGIAIKLNSKGPVFYGQERVGLNGRTFTLWKFRSMRIDAEAVGKPVWAAKNDPRVTAVGRFIRRVRIDELPQILNVLAGEMSFIGPRPERPTFVDRLSESVPHYSDRAIVKPGITGWAQVNFPYGASIEDARKKLSYDLYYVKHRSLLLHLLIMVATVRVILFQEGSR